MTLSTSDQTESWMINVTMSPRQYIPLSAHKHYDLRQTMLYIHLSTNIKLMITWPYISRYTSTLKVSWCTHLGMGVGHTLWPVTKPVPVPWGHIDSTTTTMMAPRPHLTHFAMTWGHGNADDDNPRPPLSPTLQWCEGTAMQTTMMMRCRRNGNDNSDDDDDPHPPPSPTPQQHKDTPTQCWCNSDNNDAMLTQQQQWRRWQPLTLTLSHFMTTDL